MHNVIFTRVMEQIGSAKSLLLMQFFVGLACAVFAGQVWGGPGAQAALWGSLIMLVNTSVLVWLLSRLFVKKVFALPIAIIVIKYALLMGILQTLVVTYNVHVGGLGVGLGSIVLTTLLAAGVGHVVTSEEQ